MKNRIMLIILVVTFLLPIHSFGQQLSAPFENNGLPSSQTLASPKQTPFDRDFALRAGPGGGGPGGGEEGDTGGGVGFGPVSDTWWLLCLFAIGYGLLRRKKRN